MCSMQTMSSILIDKLYGKSKMQPDSGTQLIDDQEKVVRTTYAHIYYLFILFLHTASYKIYSYNVNGVDIYLKSVNK